MRLIRLLLAAAGLALAGYGAWLLRPQLPAAATWLLAGPVLHDAVVAPVVGITGLVLARALHGSGVRWWVTAGLATTGTLLLIAVPLIWRPDPAPPNPGLQDRDYIAGLAVWLAVVWACVLVGSAAARRRAARHLRGGGEREHGINTSGSRPPHRGWVTHRPPGPPTP